VKKYIISLLSVLLSACQTHLPLLSQEDNPEKNVCVSDMEQIQLADIDYLLYANRMADELIQDDQVQKQLSLNRLKIAIAPIKYIDNAAMSDLAEDDLTQVRLTQVDLTTVNRAIKNRLIRSGLFIVVDNQQESDVSLSGYFINKERVINHCIEQYEQFSMQLENTQSQHIIWSQQKEFK